MVLIWTGFSMYMTQHYHMTLICIFIYTSWPKNEIHILQHASEYNIFLSFAYISIISVVYVAF